MGRSSGEGRWSHQSDSLRGGGGGMEQTWGNAFWKMYNTSGPGSLKSYFVQLRE